MELAVTQRRENALLDRTEVHFTLSHPEAGTPTRAEIKKTLAGALNVQGVLILDWARSEFGRTTTRGYAKVYKSKERAIALETPPILIRNGLREKVKKEEAPKEAAPKPPKREPKAEAPKKEEPPKEAPKAPAKEEAPKKEPAKAAKKEPAKKEEAPKEKKPAAKKEGK